ncbi:MAG: electron transport complex subunit E [Planctomycetes bacterium]|nr:electron transport complex subunit E [Planctomycetota bacterium]
MTTTADDPARARMEFLKGIWQENPVFVQVLGMCPALAVTNSAINALAMGLATAAVLMCSSVLISLLGRFIPSQVRISTYVIVIATFVTVVDFTLQALTPGVHKELGAFLALIVVNCLILGRQEAFASKNPPLLALLDAAGMGIGFAIALLCLGSAREILGNGSLFGFSLFGPSFEPWVIMILPPGGFLMLGLLLLLFSYRLQRQQRRAAPAGDGDGDATPGGSA